MSPGRLRSSPTPAGRAGHEGRPCAGSSPASPARSQVNQALLKEDDDLLRQTFLSVFRDHHPQVPPAAACRCCSWDAAPAAGPC